MASRSSREEEFDKLLLEIVDETVSCLGESPTKTILFYMNKKFNLPLSDVPNRLEDYFNALETMLGCGAKILGRRMMRRLYARVHPSTQCPIASDANFADFVASVKASFLQNSNDSASFVLSVNTEILQPDARMQVPTRRLA